MLKRYILVFYIIFLTSFSIEAQDFSALWEGHFSYFNVIDVTRSNTKIFAASENVIFSYDVNTNEVETITTIDGLSGNIITTIEYDLENRLLLIGYQTGLIEIYFESDDSVLSVVDILEQETIAPSLKVINDFNEHEGLVYISTDFGIVVYDLQQLEFRDTFIIGDNGNQIPVEKTTVFNDAIYAACPNGNGIRKGLLSNPNLIDFQQWQTIVNGSFVSIEQAENRLYSLRIDRVLFEIVNDVLNQRLTFNRLPIDTEVSDNQLLYTTTDDVFIYNSNATLITQVNQTEEFETEYTSAITLGEDIFVGTNSFGVLNTTSGNSQSFSEIRPEGPLFNSGFKIEAGNNELWMTYGLYDQFFVPRSRRDGISYLRNNSWRNIPNDSLFNPRDLNYISINPLNTNQVFVSSYNDGLLEINDVQATTLFNNTNSPLESLVLPGSPNFFSIRTAGTTFDTEGRIWSITSRVDFALRVYNPSNGQWQSFDFSSLIEDALLDELGFSDIVIDRNGTKWIAGFTNGVIAYNENLSEPIKNIRTEDQGLPIEHIRALAIDSSNQLWIGTDFGLRVLFNTSGFFEDPNPVAQPIIFLENGVARELLEDQFITDIIVDGSNSKWVSTTDSGVFYFTPDGQTTIFHFTTDNSPLPSNSVTDMSIDSGNGTVYFATDRGLVSFRAGGSSPEENLTDAHVFPNPVRPEYEILGFSDLNDITKGIKIAGLTENVNVKITDIEGNLVAEAQSRVNRRNSNLGFNFAIDGGTGIWNGRNLANNIVASGVYLILISDLDSFESKVLKLLIIR
ncbi:type IX secretion system anionic LPS delivery protein PorZ [Winogradskyella immobilis]|uniref:ABC transporter substrate-binding protein n=1 Tax=Winogradskyella immobilis TaxID=2816852 RepID=A0ABS8EQM3_9FLAO|nr:two-component regulator propeller domain-containing protein [Winogradskyella immobilis]MCC1485473.1 ABC transporter substrate-binding protein [Winogradskyella immobilis]MCG0017565.1 ABC transporter substrate-binding protein [Winogradskyella immobilis]